MAYRHWTIDELPWDQLDPSRVDADILKVVKAAALVEFNGHDYADHLCRVFADDPAFQRAARAWAVEEVQHGEALGRWAQAVDPDWSFADAVRRFRKGYRIDLDEGQSRRGSRSGELVARCMVETGTSSYYTALSEAAEEPVLKEICRHIAADEFRHYKLFYDHLRRYQDKERLGRLARLRITIGRINETEDDELAYAYFAANHAADRPYDRAQNMRAYMGRAYAFYRPHHLDRMVGMVFKVCGLKPQTRLHHLAARFAYRRISRQAQTLKAA